MIFGELLELGMIYFPTKFEIKEPNNLQPANHRVAEIENVFGFCFRVGDVCFSECLLPHSNRLYFTATRKSESMQDKFLWCGVLDQALLTIRCPSK